MCIHFSLILLNLCEGGYAVEMSIAGSASLISMYVYTKQ